MLTFICHKVLGENSSYTRKDSYTSKCWNQSNNEEFRRNFPLITITNIHF